jgi:hypothetical protein
MSIENKTAKIVLSLSLSLSLVKKTNDVGSVSKDGETQHDKNTRFCLRPKIFDIFKSTEVLQLFAPGLFRRLLLWIVEPQAPSVQTKR